MYANVEEDENGSWIVRFQSVVDDEVIFFISTFGSELLFYVLFCRFGNFQIKAAQASLHVMSSTMH
jgi:hypothetical protein